jgi:hypothetical protein
VPPTSAVRPLVVISIVPQVKRSFNYHLKVKDIRRFERRHGRIPRGSVVFVRSDWSRRWPDPALAGLTEFPGVSLAALKFLHLKRHILFQGHEPLDSDFTPTLEGEDWLMHHGYAQAEGVASLVGVPATGCLVETQVTPAGRSPPEPSSPGYNHAARPPGKGQRIRRPRRAPRRSSQSCAVSLAWAVLDLLITHETNGIRFNQLDRQRLKRIRYQGTDQALPEQVTAA